MPGELFEIEGEKKKRVVRAGLFLFFICPSGIRNLTSLPHTPQCYFFDSDVGGFHYGPGHPYVPVLGDDDSILNHVLVFASAVQHEAHSYSHVSFSGNELRAVQEDGDICK
jgi:hypothetical protein